MGLFKNFFQTTQKEYSFTPKNEQEAWACILLACAKSDEDFSDVEIDTISKLIVYKTFFNGHDTIAYYKRAIEAQTLLGSKTLIEKCVFLISEENKNTLFTLCCEVLLADGILNDEEKHILEFLAEELQMSDETAIKIIEVMLYRNKWNVILT